MTYGGLGGQALGLGCLPRDMSIFGGFVDMTVPSCRSDRHDGRDMSTKVDFLDICVGDDM
jgi:hypothetical protein